MSKNVIITGAAGHLGEATVNYFLNKGHKVIATIRPGKGLEGFSNPLMEALEVDLLDKEAIESLINNVSGKYEKIDALVMLAGGFDMGNIANTTFSDIQKMISLNFETAFHIAKAAFDKMSLQEEGGRLVFIGSKPSLNAKDGVGTIAYGLSKSLLFKFSEYLNVEGKSKNITSYVIAPSIVDTPPNREAMPDADFTKWVRPEEIAEIIEFICFGAGKQLKDNVLKVFGGLE